MRGGVVVSRRRRLPVSDRLFGAWQAATHRRNSGTILQGSAKRVFFLHKQVFYECRNRRGQEAPPARCEQPSPDSDTHADEDCVKQLCRRMVMPARSRCAAATVVLSWLLVQLQLPRRWVVRLLARPRMARRKAWLQKTRLRMARLQMDWLRMTWLQLLQLMAWLRPPQLQRLHALHAAVRAPPSCALPSLPCAPLQAWHSLCAWRLQPESRVSCATRRCAAVCVASELPASLATPLGPVHPQQARGSPWCPQSTSAPTPTGQ